MFETTELQLDIRRPNGATIFSNFTQDDHRAITTPENKNVKHFRTAIVTSDKYIIKIVGRKPDLINSSKTFAKYVTVVKDLVEYFIQTLIQIESNNQLHMSRLEHNLTTYNALTLQEIEVLIPQSQIAGKPWSEKLDLVKTKLGTDLKITSEAVLKIAKYSQGIKSELTAFDLIYSQNKDLKVNKHQVYRVLMNSLHYFFPDFTENGVHISMQHSEAEALFNYESVSVVLFHILNNAAKYCIPKNPVEIKIRNHGSEVKIEFVMLSVRIEDSEMKDIFHEGYSGKHATKAKLNGSGIGMFVAKNLMRLNGGNIDVQPNRSENKMYNGFLYEQNTFTLTFPANKP